MAQDRGGGPLTAQALAGIELRSIGPTLSTGRVADIEIDPKNPNVWYIASAFGGLWKTVNRGITFTPVFDNYGAFTLCCVVIDPRDSNVVWLGTGENTSQRSAHFGDGVYKSTDAGLTSEGGLYRTTNAGKTWTRLERGLPTGDMGRAGLAVDDRKNPATVFALIDVVQIPQ